ncbi:MAG TPA: hypothetical protein VKZ96_19690 [Thermomicrobiales bacterium]|nr:hypothetical protein [Thermomicrobiales bacterium]
MQDLHVVQPPGEGDPEPDIVPGAPDSDPAPPADAEPGQPPGEPAAEGPDELEMVRELIQRAYPDVVPELLAGESVAALMASLPAAREAYARIASGLRDQAPAPLPTGSGRRPPYDPDTLPPAVKIRIGLRGLGNRE